MQRNDVEESEKSRPKDRARRCGEENEGENRADGERGMKEWRELSWSESHRAGLRKRTFGARSTRICALSHSFFHFSFDDVFTSIGGNGLHACMSRNSLRCIVRWNAFVFFIVIWYLFVLQRSGGPITLVRAVLAIAHRDSDTTDTDRETPASSDKHLRNESVRVFQIDTFCFALFLNNRRAVRRRQWALSKNCYFQHSSAHSTRLYLRACTWHRALVTRQVSVDRLVLLVSIRSPFEIESPLVCAQNQLHGEEKDEMDPKRR